MVDSAFGYEIRHEVVSKFGAHRLTLVVYSFVVVYFVFESNFKPGVFECAHLQ
jgi:hypothetical protein